MSEGGTWSQILGRSPNFWEVMLGGYLNVEIVTYTRIWTIDVDPWMAVNRPNYDPYQHL